MPNRRLVDVHTEIADALGELAKLFKPGARLTFVMRMPGNTECELVVSDDDLSEVAAVIGRRTSAGNKIAPPTVADLLKEG